MVDGVADILPSFIKVSRESHTDGTEAKKRSSMASEDKREVTDFSEEALLRMEQDCVDDFEKTMNMHFGERADKIERIQKQNTSIETQTTSNERSNSDTSPVLKQSSDWEPRCPYCGTVNEYNRTMCDPVLPRICQDKPT